MTPKTPMLIRWTSLPWSVEGAKGLAVEGGGEGAIGGAAPAGLAMAWKAEPDEGSTGGPNAREEVWKGLAEAKGAPEGVAASWSVRWGTGRPTMGRKKLGGSPEGAREWETRRSGRIGAEPSVRSRQHLVMCPPRGGSRGPSTSPDPPLSPQTLSLTFFPIMAMRALRQRRHSSAVSVMQGFPAGSSRNGNEGVGPVPLGSS